MSLQSRLNAVSDAISAVQKAIDAAPKGSVAQRASKRRLRTLRRRRRELRRDRYKNQGATAIIKYEVIPVFTAAGVPVTSRKRWNPFGNLSSDHYIINRDADAADGGTHADNDELGGKVVSALKGRQSSMTGFLEFTIVRHHTGRPEVYRVQVITKLHGTGPHIHVGIKRVAV